MSITDHGAPGLAEPSYDDWGDGPAAFAPGESQPRPGERVPPQDNAAEQSVLGSMLLSKDAIADVAETVRGVDFYRPAHEVVFDAIIDLYGRGEPADPVTVAAELQRRGELQRVGGAPYLHTLSANVPIAANAGYYAEIVHEKAILRRLVDAGTKIVQIGYAGEGQVDDVVDQAQAEVYKIADRRSGEDYAPLSDIMDGVLDEIEAIGNREAGLYGVPTGFADLDDLTNGLHAGQMVIVAARPAMGKALALDTRLPTPSGWTTMGEVAVGDELYDAHGRPTRVVAATGVMHDRPCYEVTFSDGSQIVADAEHQWLTETRAARKSKWAADHHYNRTRNQRTFASVVTTEQIASTVRLDKDQRANHAVVNAGPIEGSWRRVRIPPYVLGAWLGDGHSASARITCESDEIPDVHRELWPRCPTPWRDALFDQAAGAASHRRWEDLSRLRRGVRRRCDVPALPSGPRELPGIAPSRRRSQRQAHPAGLPARGRAASTRTTRRADGHRRDRGQGRRLLPVRRHEQAPRRRRL